MSHLESTKNKLVNNAPSLITKNEVNNNVGIYLTLYDGHSTIVLRGLESNSAHWEYKTNLLPLSLHLKSFSIILTNIVMYRILANRQSDDAVRSKERKAHYIQEHEQKVQTLSYNSFFATVLLVHSFH